MGSGNNSEKPNNPHNRNKQEYKAREVFSEIRINERGVWSQKNQIIENEDILLFFKKNLHSDAGGLFIENEFKGLKEKVYIRAGGPLMNVLRVDGGNFILETGESLHENITLVRDNNEMIYIFVERLKGWAKLSRRAKNDLRERLEKENGDYTWNKIPVRHVPEMNWYTQNP